jgi:hypothetical protein
MHAGINRIIYSLSDYDIKYDSGKDGSRNETFNQGDVHWHDACRHALENTGQTEAKFLVVGFK